MTKDELLKQKADLEKEIKVFTDKPKLTIDEQNQLDALYGKLDAVEKEIENLP